MLRNSWTAIELLYNALMPKPIERSPYELERNESLLAKDRGREMDSTSEEPSQEEEDSKTESETKAITFDTDIYILTGRKGR